MKHNLSLFLIVLLFIPSLACGSFTTNPVVGSGDLVSRTIDVRNFDRVTLEGFGDVFIVQGETDSLSVETDDNIISLLDIKVSGNELTLGIKRGFDVSPTQSITYNITVQNLNSIMLAGSGNFYLEPVKSNNLVISIPGSGDIDLKGLIADKLAIDLDGSGNINLEEIHVKEVDASLKGSGDIKLEGDANNQTVRVGGSGNYFAGDFETDSTDISIPGSADVVVWVHDELKITVNGSGDVQYYGEPTVDGRGLGSGNLISLGEK